MRGGDVGVAGRAAEDEVVAIDDGGAATHGDGGRIAAQPLHLAHGGTAHYAARKPGPGECRHGRTQRWRRAGICSASGAGGAAIGQCL